jgi:hypothetical protein
VTTSEKLVVGLFVTIFLEMRMIYAIFKKDFHHNPSRDSSSKNINILKIGTYQEKRVKPHITKKSEFQLLQITKSPAATL